MPAHLDLGSLRLSCPSTGLDLALTSKTSISTLSHSCSLNTPSLTDIESGRVWVSPATNVESHVHVTWPSNMCAQQIILLNQCLVTAIRHAAVSLYISHSRSIQVTNLVIVIADLFLAMEPIEPSTLTYCQAFTMSKHLFFSTIFDCRTTIRHQQENTHSPFGQRCSIQSSQTSKGLVPLDPP